jgi:hypothetical protein
VPGSRLGITFGLFLNNLLGKYSDLDFKIEENGTQ